MTIFIGIPFRAGSAETAWNGVFEFDDIAGFKGKLLRVAPPNPGSLSAIPVELDKALLPCVIDGSEYGTIIRPEFRGITIKNFTSQIRDLRIRTLIKGVHIEENELDLLKVRVSSPVISQLFRINSFLDRVETTPYKIVIESIKNDDILFSAPIGNIRIGDLPTYSPSTFGKAPQLETMGFLELSFARPVNALSGENFIRQLEYFLSLLVFDFIAARFASFTISCRDSSGADHEKACQIIRAKRSSEVKFEKDLHETMLDANKFDFSGALSNFILVFGRIRQSLSWYRIITSEKRYIEDRFFYSLRMIETCYKALKLGPCSPDQQTSRPSLGAIISDFKQRYSSKMKALEIITTSRINKIRGKEVHGTSTPFSPKDFQFMVYATDILRTIYVLIVLEYCGLSRDLLLSALEDAFNFGWLFREKELSEIKLEI